MAGFFASSRNKRWLGLGVLLLAVSSATAVAIVKPWKKPPPVQSERLGATLELAAGEVLLATASGSERLLSRTPLPETAELSTGPGARALVRLSDGSRVFLRSMRSTVARPTPKRSRRCAVVSADGESPGF